LGRQDAVVDHAQDRGGTDRQRGTSLIDRHLTTLGALAFAVGLNVVAMTQGAAVRVSYYDQLLSERFKTAAIDSSGI
jgi:hypothetical protein